MIKRKSIWGLKIHVAIGGFSLLADALLRGSSVHTNTGKQKQRYRYSRTNSDIEIRTYDLMLESFKSTHRARFPLVAFAVINLSGNLFRLSGNLCRLSGNCYHLIIGGKAISATSSSEEKQSLPSHHWVKGNLCHLIIACHIITVTISATSSL